MGNRKLPPIFGIVFIVFLSFCMAMSLNVSTAQIEIEEGETIQATKEWTIMVYLDGDNNLEYAAIDDFNEMEAAGGTTTNVNIIAIFDRCSDSYEAGLYPEDWSGTRYYEISSDSDMNAINSVMVQDLGEQNMGDFSTLQNFVTWGKSNYPANKYALFMWDHGGGMDGVCWDEDNGDDFLDMYDLQRIPYVDFLCFDACVMGQMEVLYEVLNQCEYLGASSMNVPFDGLDYTSSLSALIAGPSMTVESFSRLVCEDYIDFYEFEQPVNYFIYDTKDLTSIMSLTNTLSQALIDDLPSYKLDIYQARFDTYAVPLLDNCDFYSLLENLESISSTGISTAANNYRLALDAARVWYGTTTSDCPRGFGIYFPLLMYEIQSQDYSDNIFNSVFIQYTLWDEFISNWTSVVNSLTPEWSTWDSGGTFSGTLSSGEYALVKASMPISSSFQAILLFEQGVEMSLAIWNTALPNYEVGGFYTSSFMPLDMPESAVFTINTLSPSAVIFFIYCHSSSGDFALSTVNYISIIDDSYEQNDDFQDAYELETNSTYGLFGFDSDYYQLDFSAGDNVILAVGSDSSNDFDLYLYDESHNPIANSAWLDNPEIIDFIADYTGTYYLEVYPYYTPEDPYYVLGNIVLTDTPPEIYDITHSPQNPNASENIVITCHVSDNYAVNDVILSYNTTTGWTNVTMLVNAYTYHTLTIPAQGDIMCMEFIIYASDDYNHWSVSSTYQIIFDLSESTPTTKLPYSYFIVILSLFSISYICIKLKR